jgi:predicted amidophosphoribosyltransferase
MMCRHARPGNLYRQDVRSTAADRSGARGRHVAAALPFLREIVDQPDALCGRCWGGITFFAPPWCALCGLPFPHPMGEDAVCGDCAREPPIWQQVRAVLRYDKNSRRLLLAFKHGDHTHSAAAFGQWMHRAGSEVLAGADLLVPVPLHWTRLFQRRYNQASLLAHAVRAAGGPEVAADWLVRRRRTPAQGHLGPAARERNVGGPLRCGLIAMSSANTW